MTAQPSRDDFNLDASRDPVGAYKPTPQQDREGEDAALAVLQASMMNDRRLLDQINMLRARRGEGPAELPSQVKVSAAVDVERRRHSHYFRDVSKLTEVDVYRTCDLFRVEDCSGAIQHAIKKLLLPGQRGAGKDRMKDIQEAIDTLNRKLEMMKEDAQ